MATLKVVRPTEVQVYGCDAAGCEESCEERSGYDGSGCDWIRFEDFTQMKQFGPNHREPTRLWFCSYQCVSDWANEMACETGEITCAA